GSGGRTVRGRLSAVDRVESLRHVLRGQTRAVAPDSAGLRLRAGGRLRLRRSHHLLGHRPAGRRPADGATGVRELKGTRVHFGVSIDGSRPFVVLSGDHYATAVHPDNLLVETPSVPRLAQGVFGRSAGKVWARDGHFDPAWLEQHGKAARAIFYDGGYLVAIQGSERFDVGAYAAIPRAYLSSRLRELALLLLPVGLALGAALVGA